MEIVILDSMATALGRFPNCLHGPAGGGGDRQAGSTTKMKALFAFLINFFSSRRSNKKKKKRKGKEKGKGKGKERRNLAGPGTEREQGRVLECGPGCGQRIPKDLTLPSHGMEASSHMKRTSLVPAWHPFVTQGIKGKSTIHETKPDRRFVQCCPKRHPFLFQKDQEQSGQSNVKDNTRSWAASCRRERTRF